MSFNDKPATPDTLEELTAGIQALLEEVAATGEEATNEGYIKCIEAMWKASYMAHEFVARQLGVTGYQHSSSSLALIGALRNMTGPFMLVDAEQALYPQYNLTQRVDEWLTRDDTLEWLAAEAKKKIAERTEQADFPMSNAVLAHWQLLASFEAPQKVEETE